MFALVTAKGLSQSSLENLKILWKNAGASLLVSLTGNATVVIAALTCVRSYALKL